MKAPWTIAAAVLLSGLLVSACSRQHSTRYHGVASTMNFERQVINPNAPNNPKLPAEVSGPVGQSIYKRHADTYDVPVPDCFFEPSCSYGSSQKTKTEIPTLGEIPLFGGGE